MSTKYEILSLTGIRGFAALWVAVMHYTWGAGHGGEGIWYQIAKYGFSGVLIFLVLSGFILAHVYSSFGRGVSKGAYTSYLYKRFARIYPLQLLTLLAALGLSYVGVRALQAGDTPFSFVLNLLLLQAWGFINDFSWNGVSWTISVEMFAYLWIPFLILALGRAPRFIAVGVLVAAILFLREGIYYKLMRSTGVDLTTLNFFYGHFLVQFSAVIIGGVALHRALSGLQWPAWISSILVIAGLAVLFYACTVPLQNWLMMSGAVLIITGLKNDDGVGRLLFGNPISVLLGNVSYTLYLIHALLNITIEHFMPSLPLLPRLALALICAVAIYYAFEKPAQSWLRSIWPRKIKPVPALSIAE